MVASPFAFASEHLLWVTPVVVGAASAGLALIMGRGFLTRRRRVVDPPAPRPTVMREGASDYDPFIHGSATEKRGALRRGGNPMPVLISDQEVKEQPYQGWILDRSTGGLCLAVGEKVQPGTIVSVRTTNAPVTIPWVQIEVKTCREVDGNWELGCRFVKVPPWSVMLLFG
jgi:hypothetical protein